MDIEDGGGSVSGGKGGEMGKGKGGRLVIDSEG